MWKSEKRPSQTLAFKEEEGSATMSNLKGHLLTPPSSLLTPRRCSKRLLEARALQTSITAFTSPSTEDPPPSTEIDTTTSQVVKQGSRLASLSSDQDILMIDKAATETQESLPPKPAFLAYSRQKSAHTHDMRSPPCEAKRGKFVEENNNNENETFKANFAPCQIKQTQVNAPVVVAPPIISPTEVSENYQAPNGEVMGLTEMANAAEKHLHEDSEDEVVSSARRATYGVREEFNSLIEKIFEKHGDIAKNHSLSSNMICSFFLEMVCDIFKKLQESTFEKIKREELDFMLEMLAPIEANGIQVEWLREKLHKIKEAKILILGSSKIKDNRERVKKEIITFEKEMLMDNVLLRAKEDKLKNFEGNIEQLQQKIKELQGSIVTVQGQMVPMREKLALSGKRLAHLKVESKEIDASALDTLKKVQSVRRQSLVDGLL